MEILSVTNLQWVDAEHSKFDAVVEFEELGIVPYTASPDSTSDYGQKIWAHGIAGEFGAIAEYVEKEPEPKSIPDEISRRQFFQYLAVLGIISRQEALAALQSGAIPAPLQAIIDELPTEDDQFEAQMFIIGAQNFDRLHPLSDTVRLALGWTVEQKDDFWREAYKL